MPDLSVLTVNLNNKSGLQKTIESVVNQDYADFEYIIIDGGSTDESIEIVEKYSSRIASWASEPDNGIYHAMNKGIRKSTGEYLLFLNSGDWFAHNNVISEVFKDSPQEDIVYGNVFYVTKQGTAERQIPPNDKTITLYDLIYSGINHQATFIHRRLFKEGLYDENFKVFSDWKFLIEQIVFKGCSLRYINVDIAYYNLEGISSDVNNKLLEHEKEAILSQVVPSRILPDYREVGLVRNSLLGPYLESLNKTYKFQRVIVVLVKLLMKFHAIFTGR